MTQVVLELAKCNPMNTKAALQAHGYQHRRSNETPTRPPHTALRLQQCGDVMVQQACQIAWWQRQGGSRTM